MCTPSKTSERGAHELVGFSSARQAQGPNGAQRVVGLSLFLCRVSGGSVLGSLVGVVGVGGRGRVLGLVFVGVGLVVALVFFFCLIDFNHARSPVFSRDLKKR